MVSLSLLTTLFALPVITLGPALAGMTKVLRTYVLDKDGFMFHEFWRGFKENLLKTIPIGLVDILFGVAMWAALMVYPAMGEQAKAAGDSSLMYTILCVISVGFGLTVFMMNFYIYPMIISTDLSMKNVLKNSFYLVALELKTNIITLVLIMLIIAVTLIIVFLSNILAFLIVPLILVAFIGFLVMFNCYPIIQKYVIAPYYKERGEDNPEYDYLKPLDPDDAVFIDKGGEEAPVKIKKKKGTKVIK